MPADPGMGIMVVLDTNVAGALLKDEPPSWLSRYHPVLESKLFALSVQTEAELRRWALRSQWGAERWAALGALVCGSLVLPADRTVAEVYAKQVSTALDSSPQLRMDGPSGLDWPHMPPRVQANPLVVPAPESPRC